MKRVGRFVSKMVAGSVVLAAMLALTSTQAAMGTAKVQAIRNGTAQFSDDGATWKPLSIGMTLKMGQTVKTDAQAIVDLFLRQNGPVLRVTPATQLALTTLTFEQAAEGETVIQTELGLSNGRILGNVKKLAAASKYDVKTPVGTCGIRGTQFDITSNGRVTVVEGSVLVTYTSPTGVTTQQTVTVGQTFDPNQNNGQGGVVATPAAEATQARTVIQAITVAAPPEGPVTVTIVAAPPPPPPSEVIEPTTKAK